MSGDRSVTERPAAACEADSESATRCAVTAARARTRRTNDCPGEPTGPTGTLTRPNKRS